MNAVDEELWAAKVYLWLEQHMPRSKGVRTAFLVLLGAAVIGIMIVLLTVPLAGGESGTEQVLLPLVTPPSSRSGG